MSEKEREFRNLSFKTTLEALVPLRSRIIKQYERGEITARENDMLLAQIDTIAEQLKIIQKSE